MEFSQEDLMKLWKEEFDFNLDVRVILGKYARGKTYEDLNLEDQMIMSVFLYRAGVLKGSLAVLKARE